MTLNTAAEGFPGAADTIHCQIQSENLPGKGQQPGSDSQSLAFGDSE